MKFYGGYQGKRVANKKSGFKLLHKQRGKRLAKKLPEESFLYQTMQLISGKIKYLFSKKKVFSEQQEELLVEEYEEPEVEKASIEIIEASSLEDISDILYFIEAGFIVIVNYRTLNMENRKKFDKQLSKELLLLGIHLTHVSSTCIVCAGNSISITDQISEKQGCKIYDIGAYRKG